MKITSTNIAKPTTILWHDKKVVTGIYKTPTKAPIFLGKEDVRDDTVSDRKYHGGEFKACYLFSEKHYEYWKSLYPDLDWNWGMMGENLTVSSLDETQIYVGDIYQIGKTKVQITEPREPCFKLGVRFKNQNVIKQFINHGFPGTYVRVLEEGFVETNDSIKLLEHAKDSLTTAQLYQLIFAKVKDKALLKKAIKNKALPEEKRKKFQSLL